MPIGHIFRVAAYCAQTGRNELTPAQRRRCRHKLGRALAVRQAEGVRASFPALVRKDPVPPASSATFGASRH